MSLFKVFKGNSSSLNSQTKHDGYAWYTQDDGGFYIDAEDSESVVQRKRINDADNINVTSSSFSSHNLKTILEGLESKPSEISMSYDSSTETLIITGV